ncbi:MAG TPA: protein-tyrosine phosphatase family protein [Terriglobia bacterium]|nr:protein-tyrosine phosphatase family protein [Terriglobia bacterium]
MTPTLYWINGPWAGRLAISARPRGGDWLEEEVAGWRESGVNAVASLLTPDEVEGLGLGEEARLSQKEGITFMSFPIPDRGVPASREKALDFLRQMEAGLAQGRNAAIHCRQGVGRSALIAAGLLVLGGADPEQAFELLSKLRGCSLPETAEQRKWVEQFAKDAVPARLTG